MIVFSYKFTVKIVFCHNLLTKNMMINNIF